MPLTAPTLSLVDNENGTGAVATISGSTAGSTNSVYTARWFGGFVNGAFTLAGSRTGDGTISLSLPDGYHWGYVLSTKAGEESVVSAMVGFRTTSGDESLWQQCLDAIVAKIQAIGLSGIPSEQVYPCKIPLDRDTIKPCCLVSPIREAAITHVFSTTDQLPLDFQVALEQASNQDLIEGIDVFTMNRQRIINAFLPTTDTGLPAVQEVVSVQVVPGDVYNVQAWMENVDAGAVVIRCLCQVNRALV
jgi:hypothetical protein